MRAWCTMEAATPREMDGRRPFLTCLFSSHIFVSLFEEVHLILHLSLPPRTFHQLLCLMHSSKHKIHEDRDASILAKNRNNNKKKVSKNSLAESPSINPHNNPITRRKRIPLFEFAHVFKPLQIQSDTRTSMILCMEGTYSLLAIVANDFQRLWWWRWCCCEESWLDWWMVGEKMWRRTGSLKFALLKKFEKARPHSTIKVITNTDSHVAVALANAISKIVVLDYSPIGLGYCGNLVPALRCHFGKCISKKNQNHHFFSFANNTRETFLNLLHSHLP